MNLHTTSCGETGTWCFRTLVRTTSCGKRGTWCFRTQVRTTSGSKSETSGLRMGVKTTCGLKIKQDIWDGMQLHRWHSFFLISLVVYGMHRVVRIVDTFICQVQRLVAGWNVAQMATCPLEVTILMRNWWWIMNLMNFQYFWDKLSHQVPLFCWSLQHTTIKSPWQLLWCATIMRLMDSHGMVKVHNMFLWMVRIIIYENCIKYHPKNCSEQWATAAEVPTVIHQRVPNSILLFNNICDWSMGYHCTYK